MVSSVPPGWHVKFFSELTLFLLATLTAQMIVMILLFVDRSLGDRSHSLILSGRSVEQQQDVFVVGLFSHGVFVKKGKKVKTLSIIVR